MLYILKIVSFIFVETFSFGSLYRSICFVLFMRIIKCDLNIYIPLVNICLKFCLQQICLCATCVGELQN